jgi:uncharacterized protein (AIM24 family)
MRTFFLALVVFLAVPSAVGARTGGPGDGTFAVKNAVGQITVNAKGTVLGKLDAGSITVQVTTPGGLDDMQVIGFERKSVKNGTTVYRSENPMRFRFVGGWVSVAVTGSGVNISAVGRGTVSGQGISEGLFSTDGARLQPVPSALYGAFFGQQ